MRKKINLGFLIFIAFVPIFCVLLDMFMSTARPVETEQELINFDYSIISQITYFSVWTALVTSIWGLTAIVSSFRKENKITWAESDNVLVMIVVYQLMVFIIYTGTFAGSNDSIVGFNTWYKIIKSILEHWLTPIVVVVYFVLRKRSSIETDNKTYLKQKAWMNCIIPFMYVVFVGIRGIMIIHYGKDVNHLTPFPYAQLDPTKSPFALWLPLVIGFVMLPYFTSALLNYSKLKLSIRINEKYYLY